MDIKTAKGFAILPTRGRVNTRLPEFFKAARETGMTIPGYVVIDDNEYAQCHDAYDALELPANWGVYVTASTCCAEATELARRELFDDQDYLFWLADDLIPVTPEWDAKVIEALNGFNMVSTDDGVPGKAKFNGATAWSGDLVRAVGYLYPAGCRHFYIDTMWQLIGEAMNVWVHRNDVLVRHAHESKTGNADATTVHTHKAWLGDEAAWVNWKNHERIPAIERVGDLLIECGVSAKLPDMSDIHVLICTPCGSGRYEQKYMRSLFTTIEALRSLNATVNTSEILYCSDVALARTKLFGNFLRSGATHMMCIDDDMGWNPQDIIRMFSYKRDYVAGAGPRKVFPPSFAVQCADERGKASVLRQEADTGLFEVSHIGMAFTLLTRSWAEKMVAAYPDLEFSGDDGRVEYAIFNPMVVNRRYMSEDFSVCERWRRIGGKVYVDAGVTLDHVGSFVWTGAWIEQLALMVQAQKQAA